MDIIDQEFLQAFLVSLSLSLYVFLERGKIFQWATRRTEENVTRKCHVLQVVTLRVREPSFSSSLKSRVDELKLLPVNRRGIFWCELRRACRDLPVKGHPEGKRMSLKRLCAERKPSDNSNSMGMLPLYPSYNRRIFFLFTTSG